MPWGWWLRAINRGYEDVDGHMWPTVREAFWHGAIGLPREPHDKEEQEQEQELMLRVLTAIDVHPDSSGENRGELFHASSFDHGVYGKWLVSLGLLDASEARSVLTAPLSDKGRGVMLMLQATRDPIWVDLPTQEIIDGVGGSRDAAADAREAALRAFETGMTPLPHVFAREKAGDAHLVTLTSIDPRDRMPTRRVVWSLSFRDDAHRDDMFGWLAERVHRWDGWGGIVRRQGAAALTSHLLGMLVASPMGKTCRFHDV